MRQKLCFGIILAALVGSQFGIAIAVNEWRGRSRVETVIQQETLRDPIPSQTELDIRKCEAALNAAGAALTRETTDTAGLRTINENRIAFGPSVPDNINNLINRYC